MASTPGEASEADLSTETMRAWAWGERTNAVYRSWQMDVVGEAASAGEKTKILLPTDGLSNGVRHDPRQVHARYSAAN